MKTYAYYFPNWHQDKRNDLWHGKGWTEWEVVKCARPRFPGHKQPNVPLWGYEDEADPAVMAKKISAAQKYGIDGFIFDTYYYDDGPYRQRCLDEGFLKAENSASMEFAIMWCNHDAIYAHPSPRNIISPTLKSSAVDEAAFVRITDDFIRKYFTRENYIRVDGKLLFIIYNVWNLAKQLGGLDETARILSEFRGRVRDAGLGEIQLGCVPEMLDKRFNDRTAMNRLLKVLGIDEGIRYWWPVTYNDARLTVEYDDFVEAGIGTFEDDLNFYDIPVDPVVMRGLDQSPRTIQSEIYENMNDYPWYAIVDHCTVEGYERALRAAYEFTGSDRFRGHFVGLIWNEWTEGNFLEPSTDDGYAYLEAVKRVQEEMRVGK